MNVLVLDDHEAFRREMADMLVRNGHQARAVGNAKEAIPLAESGEYDFVLVDFNMPEQNGVWFMENVRLPPRTKALLVTAHVSKHVVNRMFDTGVSGYLVKPFDEADLLRHLDFHCAGRRTPGASS